MLYFATLNVWAWATLARTNVPIRAYLVILKNMRIPPVSTLTLVFATFCASTAFGQVTRWKQEARDVTITRDDWGIPHIHGKTDADAVFVLLYAQAEDDFNRVEMNYINAMGRLAEVEGEGAVMRDLRMKLFIDPDS